MNVTFNQSVNIQTDEQGSNNSSTSSSETTSALVNVTIENVIFLRGALTIGASAMLAQNPALLTRTVALSVTESRFGVDFAGGANGVQAESQDNIGVVGVARVHSVLIKNNTMFTCAAGFDLNGVTIAILGDIVVENNYIRHLEPGKTCSAANYSYAQIVISGAPSSSNFTLGPAMPGTILIKGNDMFVSKSDVFAKYGVAVAKFDRVGFILVVVIVYIVEMRVAEETPDSFLRFGILVFGISSFSSSSSSSPSLLISNNTIRLAGPMIEAIAIRNISGDALGSFTTAPLDPNNSPHSAEISHNTIWMNFNYSGSSVAQAVIIGGEGTTMLASSVSGFRNLLVDNNKITIVGHIDTVFTPTQLLSIYIMNSVFLVRAAGVVFSKYRRIDKIIVSRNVVGIYIDKEKTAQSNVMLTMSGIMSDVSMAPHDIVEVHMISNQIHLSLLAVAANGISFPFHQLSFSSPAKMLKIVNFSDNILDLSGVVLVDDVLGVSGNFIVALLPKMSTKPSLTCFLAMGTALGVNVENNICEVTETRLEVFGASHHFIDIIEAEDVSLLERVVARRNNFTISPLKTDVARFVVFPLRSHVRAAKMGQRGLSSSPMYLFSTDVVFVLIGPMRNADVNPPRLKQIILENNFVNVTSASVSGTDFFTTEGVAFGTSSSPSSSSVQIFNNIVIFKHIVISLEAMKRATCTFISASTTTELGFYRPTHVKFETIATFGATPYAESGVFSSSSWIVADIVDTSSMSYSINNNKSMATIHVENNLVRFSSTVSDSSSINQDNTFEKNAASVMLVNATRGNFKATLTVPNHYQILNNNVEVSDFGSFHLLFIQDGGGTVPGASEATVALPTVMVANVQNNIARVKKSLPDKIFGRPNTIAFIGWNTSTFLEFSSITLRNNKYLGADEKTLASFYYSFSSNSFPIRFVAAMKSLLSSSVGRLDISAPCNSIFSTTISPDELTSPSFASYYESINYTGCGNPSATSPSSNTTNSSMPSTTATPNKPVSLDKIPAINSLSASATLALSSLAAVPSIAAVPVRTQSVLSGLSKILSGDCGSLFTADFVEDLPPIANSPTQLYFSGDGNGGYATGSVIGNFILILSLSSFWFLGAVLVEKLLPKLKTQSSFVAATTPRFKNNNVNNARNDNQKKSFFSMDFFAESRVMIPLSNFSLMFLDPMINSTIAVISIPQVGLTWKIVCALISLFLLVLFFFCFIIFYKLLLARTVVEKYQKRKPVNESNRSKNTHNSCVRLWKFLMEPEGYWLTPRIGHVIPLIRSKKKINDSDKNKNSKKTGRRQEEMSNYKVTEHDIRMWRFAEPIVDGFTSRFPKFVIVDVTVVLCLSLATIIGAAVDNCVVLGALLMAPVTAHAVVCILFRPDQELLLRFFIPFVDLLQVAVLACALAGVDDTRIEGLVLFMTSVQMFLTILWIIAIGISAFDFVEKYRRDRSRKNFHRSDKTERNASSSSLKSIMAENSLRNNNNNSRDRRRLAGSREDSRNRHNKKSSDDTSILFSKHHGQSRPHQSTVRKSENSSVPAKYGNNNNERRNNRPSEDLMNREREHQKATHRQGEHLPSRKNDRFRQRGRIDDDDVELEAYFTLPKQQQKLQNLKTSSKNQNNL